MDIRSYRVASLLKITLSGWLTVGENIQVRPSNLSGTVAYVGNTKFSGGTHIYSMVGPNFRPFSMLAGYRILILSGNIIFYM